MVLCGVVQEGSVVGVFRWAVVVDPNPRRIETGCTVLRRCGCSLGVA